LGRQRRAGRGGLGPGTARAGGGSRRLGLGGADGGDAERGGEDRARKGIDSGAKETLSHGNPEKSKSARIVPRPGAEIEWPGRGAAGPWIPRLAMPERP
ncbi:hypothetical protein LZC36_09780, partial [Campylobacter jejuni]